MNLKGLWFATWVIVSGAGVFAEDPKVELGPYPYESRPDHDAFRGFNPRKAPPVGPLLLVPGDRLAICGDSITEQKMYSRLIEAYLTACTPELHVTVRQLGWSGEKTDGFLRRMERDCLTFKPTVATLSYGMNDSRYRPFDVNNGLWYRDHYRAIVRRFKQDGVRVVVGSPGSAGKIATWVKSRAGTLEQHNIHLCALRDIAMGVAQSEGVRFADVFWPMYQAQVLAPQQHGATDEQPYLVAGGDGIHPGWAGQTLMAWAFLRALGLDGEIGVIAWDVERGIVDASEGHQVGVVDGNSISLTSNRYPFCSQGEQNDDNSVRSGLTLVPFDEELNRFLLQLSGIPDGTFELSWGDHVKRFSADRLREGINLASEFRENPFSEPFAFVSEAVARKQAYETQQIKKDFHSDEARTDFESVVKKTEAIRQPLANAVAESVRPVTHRLSLRDVTAD